MEVDNNLWNGGLPSPFNCTLTASCFLRSEPHGKWARDHPREIIRQPSNVLIKLRWYTMCQAAPRKSYEAIRKKMLDHVRQKRVFLQPLGIAIIVLLACTGDDRDFSAAKHTYDVRKLVPMLQNNLLRRECSSRCLIREDYFQHRSDLPGLSIPTHLVKNWNYVHTRGTESGV